VCGIAGVVDPEGVIDRARLHELNECQRHRGPDDHVVAEFGEFALANTRLAIRDPSTNGNQPFETPDGSIVVVFNGEIYNADQLANGFDIHRAGVCDGEVIPYLWRLHGPSCLSLLRGMWAMAILDRRSHTLTLARDPFGIKPLHWRQVGRAFVFASEMRGLSRFSPSPAADAEAVGSFLRWGSIPAGSSPWCSIESLDPGECVSVDRNGAVTSIGTLPPLDLTKSPPGPSLVSALESSVRAHVRADVPTTLLLSSGVDSSLLAATAARDGIELHCLTVAEGAGRDEAPTAAATARRYGHSHERVEASLDESGLEGFLSHMDRPTIDGLNTFVVCEAVHRAGFKVALSGLGGDEALGGYRASRLVPWLPALRLLDRCGTPTRRLVADVLSRRGSASKARRLVDRGPRTVPGLVALERELFDAATVRRLVGNEGDRRGAEIDLGGRSVVQLLLAESAIYLQPMLLPDADTFSMAWSVELRVPFVDGPFLDAASRRRRRAGKWELIRQLDDAWLRRLARQPKQGFALPMGEWIRSGPLEPVVAEARSSAAPLWDVVDRRVGLSILEGADANGRWAEAWSLAVLDGWLRRR
jgi:asparagine synthase (glutamine-hydrolysing)